MNNQSKKLQNLRESSDAIFQELFGFGKKKSNTKPASNSVIEKIEVGKYRMGKSIITGISGASDSEILNFDWKNSDLRWLISCEFEGNLNLDLKKEVLNSFGGIWKKGVFKGLMFSNHSEASFGIDKNSQVQFGDETVSPKYIPSYNTWKVSPLNFFDGTIDRETGGILGMQNAVNGPVRTRINILTLAPNKTLEISERPKTPVRGPSGQMQAAPISSVHKIRMVKRIDSKDSEIIIEIENGETGDVRMEPIPWSEFRTKGSQSMIFTLGKTTSFFGIDLSNSVISAEVIDSGKSRLNHAPNKDMSAEKKLASSQQVFDLKKLPYINIDKPSPGPSGKIQPGIKITDAYFYLPTVQYLKKFNEVKKNIDNGVISSDIDIIASGLRNGLIKGYYNNPILAPLFNNIPGGDAAPKGYEMSLSRLSDLIQYFVDRIYVKGDNGKVDEPTQDLIKNKLKKVLKIDSYIKQTTQSTQSGTPSSKKPTSKINIAESKVLETYVRNILYENLKHF